MFRWLLIVVLITHSFIVKSQKLSERLSVSFKDLPLELVLDSISIKTGYQFSYNSSILPRGSLFQLNRNNIHIDSLMKVLLVGTNIFPERFDDLIILRKVNSDRENTKSTKPITLLSGWVREFNSKDPIEGVNIHLNGTMIGTSSDQYGNYEIKNIPEGSYTLVFSHVGYQVVTHSLNIGENASLAVNALMNVKIEKLDELELVSTPFVTDKEWPRFYRLFVREFLGTSSNAIKCEILNPEVLNFSYDEELKTMYATADEALIIHNNGLGYKIIYELQSFDKTPTGTSFYGLARFENLELPAKRMRRKWKKNRLKSFEGSINHFLKALINGNLNNLGYKVYRIDSMEDIDDRNFKYINTKRIIQKSENTYEWYLKFDGMIVVQYNNEAESSQYIFESSERPVDDVLPITNYLKAQSGSQLSVFQLNQDSVTLDRYGQIKEPFGARTMGYWSWERVGEMVPAEYNPKTDNL